MNGIVRTGVLLFTVATVAFGQGYTPAVRPNALDASRQIGSGGYNAPTRSYSNYGGGGFGNLYITRNVTGGKGFQGFVPYSDPTQFNSRLGSTSLNNFERDASSLRRVEQGYLPGQALPFYNSSSTILPLSAQTQGLTLPGSLIPRTQVLPRPESYGTRALLSPMTTEGFVRLPDTVRSTDVLVPNIVLPQQLPSQVGQPTAATPTPAPLERPMKLEEQQMQKTEETQRPELRLEQPQLSPAPGQPEQGQPQDYSAWLGNQAELAEQPQIRVGFQEDTLEQARRLGIEGHLSQTTQPATQEQRALVPSPTPEAKPLETSEDLRIKRPSAVKSGQPVVSTLAGTGNDSFSQVMRLGQRLLSQGKFYEAYQTYTQALPLKEKDPMPIFGQAHALIAAGDLRSAAAHLQAALTQFPKFLRLQLDGARLIGSPSILDRRREQLENLAKKNSDPQVKLLLGYVEVLSGHRETGLKHMAQSGLVNIQ